MRVVVTAIIERSDRRFLIGQRRRDDTSPLKWEFPGGKIEEGETPEAALARELLEKLGALAINTVRQPRNWKFAFTPLASRKATSQQTSLNKSSGLCPKN